MDAEVSGVREVRGRGYTPARRLLVSLADGTTVFAKVAVNESTAEWLAAEHVVYSQVEGPFLPRFLGYDDAKPALLLLEDLSDAHWPPPWPEGSIAAVLGSLEKVAATGPPHRVPPVEIYREEILEGWALVAQDTGPFLSFELCSREWLVDALPILLEAARTAPIEGESLLHFDVRSDNIALVSDRAVLVDWNWACIGNPMLELATWAPSLHVEGGPPPEELVPGCPPGFPALLAGFWAARIGLPPPEGAAPGLRDLQLAQLRVVLPWAVRALDLTPLG
ncbi:MAG: phosphotransferase [Actinobacteria bacterium]|nr:phosphotransferase [Actinomycetota bacterium]